MRSSAAVFLAVCLVSATALGDGFESVPLGARTAAMGGAAQARGSDAAMPWANPAGIALLPGSVLSLSASLYRISGARVPKFLADANQIELFGHAYSIGELGAESREVTAFPSSIAYFLNLGTEPSVVLAASLAVPRSVRRTFFLQTLWTSPTGPGYRQTISNLIENTSQAGGLSAAIGWSSLRLGASILLARTREVSTDRSTDLFVVQNGDVFRRLDATEIVSATSWDLTALIGAQWDVTDWLSIGASVRAPSLHLGGELDFEVDYLLSGNDPNAPPAAILARSTDGELELGMPLRAALGVEVRGDGWGVAADVTVFVPRTEEFATRARVEQLRLAGAIFPDGSRVGVEQVDAPIDLDLVIDAAIGVEVRLADFGWLRGGVFTTRSALPGGGHDADAVFAFPIDRYGGALGLQTSLGPVDTTFGIRGDVGFGDTTRIVPASRVQGVGELIGEPTGAMVYDLFAFASAAVDLTELVKP